MGFPSNLLTFALVVCAGCAVDVDTADGDLPGDPPLPPSADARWAPWPMLGQGPMHSSRSLSTTVGPHRTWDLELGEVVRGSCVIGAGGTIYAATAHALTAISADGDVLWTKAITFPDEEPPSPAVGPDGSIYVRNGDGLTGFDPDGSVAFAAALEFPPLGSPTVTSDGSIYVSQTAGDLVVLAPDGSIRASYAPSDERRYSTPTFAVDGSFGFMLVDTFASHFWVFDEHGDMGVAVDALGPIYGYQAFPVSAPDGSHYVATDGGLVAFDAAGTALWSFSRASNNFGPALGADGTIYWASGGPLIALRPDGTERWTVSESACDVSAAVGPDGSVYCGGDRLVVADASGATTSIDLGSPVSSLLAIDDDGTVIFGTEDGRLHAR